MVSVCCLALAEGGTPTAVARPSPLSWEALVAASTAAAEPGGEAEAASAPPLPLLSIEGVSGGLITPMAYMCNADTSKASGIGKPTIAYIYGSLGSKNLHAMQVTETFFGRIELGYAVNILDLGSLPHDLAKSSLPIGRSHVCLHHFNARAMLIEENSFDLPLPAVTAGAHFKYNDGIKDINRQLSNALSSVGYDRHYGVDYTLTASKTFGDLAFGRPLILTAGMRNSRAAQLGLLGFGGTCKTTVEASAACLVTDQLLLAYEFRQKNGPYTRITKLVEDEKNWHAVSLSYVINENITVTGAWGCLGNIANANADSSFLMQVRIEF